MKTSIETRTTSEKHPLDWEALQKGTWLETEEIEKATLCRRSDPFFSLRAQNLGDRIERKTGILCRTEGPVQAVRIRLMTDSEALEYQIREAGRASRKLERVADRLADNIDRTKLSELEQQIHDHARRMVGAMADAQKREKRAHHEMFLLMAKKHGELPADAILDPDKYTRDVEY